MIQIIFFYKSFLLFLRWFFLGFISSPTLSFWLSSVGQKC
ncbi:hypothetical Protein YC6258_03163 [Gynuella sunshinyii YC6258]|uniref:Uncharacterized protein n=1 Tax=Gynuella sunshinyii YC6258 TaxID=1445510 RepID=A0A0C5VXT6_9GAMM|nr:hypothetical Protein YC6258_03163 [Gynuella sunshinyii YC6258]